MNSQQYELVIEEAAGRRSVPLPQTVSRLGAAESCEIPVACGVPHALTIVCQGKSVDLINRAAQPLQCGNQPFKPGERVRWTPGTSVQPGGLRITLVSRREQAASVPVAAVRRSQQSATAEPASGAARRNNTLLVIFGCMLAAVLMAAVGKDNGPTTVERRMQQCLKDLEAALVEDRLDYHARSRLETLATLLANTRIAHHAELPGQDQLRRAAIAWCNSLARAPKTQVSEFERRLAKRFADLLVELT
jgi:hypothetical protein